MILNLAHIKAYYSQNHISCRIVSIYAATWKIENNYRISEKANTQEST